jgi:hypothetical protein
MKVHATLSLPQAMWMAKFSESECKNRTMQMRVRRAHLAQEMPMVGTDIDVAGTPTMSSLSTQEGTITKTSIPTESNASSAAAEVATALFPAPQPEEPPHPTATSLGYSRGRILKNGLSCWPRQQHMAPNGWRQAAAIS